MADDWLWDSWIADDGDLYHLFFLEAPKALGDPGARHTAARIGHARSTDLTNWTLQPDALLPAANGWDDLALWTGSVVRGEDSVWRMYYTALSTKAGHGVRDQRIGLAESEDLGAWRRVGDRPLVNPDPRWYRMLDEDPAASETWRDPFVFKDPGGDGWHMLITARSKDTTDAVAGVLAHARSDDLVTWAVQPPLTQPAGFDEIEVAQVRVIDGRWVLVFTCHPQKQSAELMERVGGGFSTWYVVGDSLEALWNIGHARPFVDEPQLFAAPLTQLRDGTWAFVGFLNQEAEGIASFELIDPIRLTFRGGELRRA